MYIALAEHLLHFGRRRPTLSLLFSSDIARLLSDETLAREIQQHSQTILREFKTSQKKRTSRRHHMFQVLINALILGVIDKKVACRRPFSRLVQKA
jgi:hypothetical protein